MQARRFVATAAATALAASVGLVLTGLAPASAGDGPPDNGVNPVEDGQEIGAGANRPGTEKVVPIDGKFTPRAAAAFKCIDGADPVYQAYDGSQSAWIPEPQGKPADQPNAQWWFRFCHADQALGAEPPSYTPLGWNTGGPPPPQPSAQDIVLPAWAYVKGLLENPALTLSPPASVASVVNLPAFVAIGNPQPSTLYTASAGGVAVWIAVIPTVTMHPGEPAAPAIPCDDEGSTFVRGAGTPQAQAEGACAYTYTQKSAAGGWPGDVTITWNVTWGSNQPGQSGDFNDDVVPNVSAFGRQVDEVQGVVTDPG